MCPSPSQPISSQSPLLSVNLCWSFSVVLYSFITCVSPNIWYLMMPILELYIIISTWDACCSVAIANKVALSVSQGAHGQEWLRGTCFWVDCWVVGMHTLPWLGNAKCFSKVAIPVYTPLVVTDGEGNGNPLQYSCLENPREWGSWWAAIYGVAQSRTWLKWLSSSSSKSWPCGFVSHPGFWLGWSPSIKSQSKVNKQLQIYSLRMWTSRKTPSF